MSSPKTSGWTKALRILYVFIKVGGPLAISLVSTYHLFYLFSLTNEERWVQIVLGVAFEMLSLAVLVGFTFLKKIGGLARVLLWTAFAILVSFQIIGNVVHDFHEGGAQLGTNPDHFASEWELLEYLYGDTLTATDVKFIIAIGTGLFLPVLVLLITKGMVEILGRLTNSDALLRPEAEAHEQAYDEVDDYYEADDEVVDRSTEWTEEDYDQLAEEGLRQAYEDDPAQAADLAPEPAPDPEPEKKPEAVNVEPTLIAEPEAEQVIMPAATPAPEAPASRILLPESQAGRIIEKKQRRRKGGVELEERDGSPLAERVISGASVPPSEELDTPATPAPQVPLPPDIADTLSGAADNQRRWDREGRRPSGPRVELGGD